MEVKVEESENFLDTKGLCLLCLIKVEPEWEQSMSTSSISVKSFQCLSRYLELDLCKILNVRKTSKAKKLEEGLGFKGPQLKVMLCEECTLITEKFSELCEQLTDCLEGIRKKLLNPEETGLVHLLGKSEHEVKPRRGRKKKILTAGELRKELVGKCSDKLSMLLPSRPYGRQNHDMTPRSVDLEPDPLLESPPPRESSKTPEDDVGIDEMGNDDKVEVDDDDDKYYDEDDGNDNMDNNDKVDVDDDLREDDDKYENEDDGNDNMDNNDDEDWNQDSELSDDSRQPQDMSSSSSGSDNEDDYDDNEKDGDQAKENDLEIIKSASSPSNRLKRPRSKNDINPSVIPINPETGMRRCTICFKEYVSWQTARIHYKTVHLKKKGFCKKCKKYFKHKHNVCDRTGPINKCRKCKVTFAQKSDYIEHQQTSSCWAENRARRIRTCELCGKTFDRPSYLKLHMEKAHLNVRDHVCDQCGKAFCTLGHLKSHVDCIHLKLLQHECKECGKRFLRREQLKTHVKSVHLQEKYVCHECGKVYPLKNSLECHIKLFHLRARDHSCNLCDEKFISERQLNTHRGRVHQVNKNGRPRRVMLIRNKLCPLCGKSYYHNHEVTKHIRRMHQQKRNVTSSAEVAT